MRCQRNALSSMLTENSAAALAIALVRTLANAAPSPRRSKREISQPSNNNPSHGRSLRQRGGGAGVTAFAVGAGASGVTSYISPISRPAYPNYSAAATSRALPRARLEHPNHAASVLFGRLCGLAHEH